MEAVSACCTTHAEDTSSEEEGAGASAGPRCCLGNPAELKPYCACGKSLRRVARLPGHHALLACSTAHDCCRCGEVILPGELHFRCRSCVDLKVCKDCGPGIFIEHTFDFYEPSTGEVEIQEIPSRVLHWRRARQAKRTAARTRSLSLAPGSENDELARKVAFEVVQAAEAMVQEVMDEETDVTDKEWGDEGLLERLLCAPNQQQVCENVRILASAAIRIFTQSQTVQDVRAPCKVYGDLHGQLRDLLLLFGVFGMPGTAECPSAVFNGDFVDRGKHQVEVLCLLLALKVAYPQNVFLNRGNHEESQMNQKYGFARACVAAFSEEESDDLFRLISKTFSMLPLASLIDTKVLVVHGGIGDGKWSVDELRKVRRPLKLCDLQQDRNQWLWNLMWSDPIEDDEKMSSSRVFGVHSSPRGKLAVKFGWNVTQAFCARNGLDLVVRSHQAKKCGLGFDVMHNESLIRVFSARDYEGHNNDCAVLSIFDDAEEEGASGGVLVVRPQVLSSCS
mmetsp:Transcript_61731/g.179064  ORF Transcript_61731/g.179064 Transcript_61731/m.179064 type:complete len:507 (+) Transcript_61731:61-1581(+)